MSKIAVREAAGDALQQYAVEIGATDLDGNLTDPETTAADLIADLLHKLDEVLAERVGLSILRRAQDYYEFEMSEEEAA